MIRIFSSFGLRVILTIVVIVLIKLVVFRVFNINETPRECECGQQRILATRGGPTSTPVPDWERTLNFTGFNNETGTPDGHFIVPNYVHFLRFQTETFSLMHMVCVLAAFKHQRPEKLFIHTDVERFHGKYWDVIINTPGLKEVLVINRIDLPTEVFGNQLNKEWVAYHGADVARLKVMIQYGGIYLDNDSYLIRRMDDLRRYELVVAWRPGQAMMNQVVVAHKDARLLKEWLDGYKNYSSTHWFYNAGRYPADVLLKQPHLAHSERDLLGTYDIRGKIYTKVWPEWRTYYSCHLMIRWVRKFKGLRYPHPIQEKDVLKHKNTFLMMVQDVYDIKKVKFKN